MTPPRSNDDLLQKVFIENSKASRATARRYARERGFIPYKCPCGNEGTWLDKPLPLELHHRNGRPTDHRLENLEFTCPNCHSQQPNTNRAKTKPKQREEDVLKAFLTANSMRDLLVTLGMVDNGVNYQFVKRVLKRHDLWFRKPAFSLTDKALKEQARRNPINKKGERLNKRKVCWPSAEDLKRLLWEKPVGQIGKDFGVSGGAVEKWCVRYNITSKPPRGYWAKRAAGMSHEQALLPPPPKQKASERKLTDQQVQDLLKEMDAGKESFRSLSIRYAVSRNTMTRLKTNGGYKNGASRRTCTLTIPGSNPG